MNNRTRIVNATGGIIRFGQINLGKGKGATSDFIKTCAERKLDVLLIQEPNVLRNKVLGFSSGFRVINKTVERLRSCIVLNNANIMAGLLEEISCELITVAEIITQEGSIFVVSVYFPPVTRCPYREDDLFERLGEVLRNLKDAREVDRIIIGGDFNAKCTTWGGDTEDRRGIRLAELFETYDLTVLNDGSGPTFVGPRGNSYIDVTAADFTAYREIERWEVDVDGVLTEHKLVTWVVKADRANNEQANVADRAVRFCNRKADWGKFRDKYEELIPELEATMGDRDIDADTKAQRLNDAIQEACRASMPVQKKFQRSVPWWTPELTAKRAETRRARRQAQRARGDAREDLQGRYRILAREYKDLIEKTRTDKWKTFCTRNSEKDPWGTAYKVVRGNRKNNDVISCVKTRGGRYTKDSRETVDYMLAEFFPGDPQIGDNAAHRNLRQTAADARGSEIRDKHITANEIRRALRGMNPKKAPGHDGITADAVLHAFEAREQIFVRLFNDCLEAGAFPRVWKTQSVRFIPKPGKTERTDVRSFRPISLLPVTGKVLDKVMTWRVQNLIDQGGGFNNNQYGFRAGRTTTDAIEEMLGRVNDARDRGNYCAIIALDIAGAFDNAWWPRIIAELESRECPGNLMGLIRSYFDGRTARVELPGDSVSRGVERGCPQGSCSGPTFWNLAYESVYRVELPEGCDIISFADDTALIVRAAQFKRLKEKGTEALASLLDWARDEKLEFNVAKTEALFFGKRPGQERPTFRMGEGRVYCKDQIKYLGVMIDDRLSWNQHIEYASRKGRELSHKIGAAARLTWGFRGESVARIYEGAIQPAIAYGAAIWARDLKVRQVRKLKSAQRILAVRAARAYKTISTEAALCLSRLLPIDIMLGEEVKKRVIFARHGQQPPGIIAEINLEGRPIEEIALPRELGHPADVGGFRFDEADEDAINIREGIAIYTDGSRMQDGRSGAAFVVYNEEREVHTAKYKLGEWSSIFQCELLALREALTYIRDHIYAFRECTIYSDSKSALSSLQTLTRPTRLQVEVWLLHQHISREVDVRFAWVRSHIGIMGNERADELAKEAAELDVEPVYNSAPRNLVKKRIRAHSRRLWNEGWATASTGRLTAQFIPTIESRQKLGTLSKEVVQLITGHGNFRAYLARIGKLAADETRCECGETEDAEHVVFACRLEERHRARADRNLAREGYRWPRNAEEATAMAEVAEWWRELSEFASRVERLKLTRD